jgi:hypothetical protein
MRGSLGIIYLIAFIFGLLIFLAGNSLGSGMFCNGYCAFEQDKWSIAQEIGLALLLAGAFAGTSSRQKISRSKDIVLALAAIPLAAILLFLCMFLSVAVLGRNSPFF